MLPTSVLAPRFSFPHLQNAQKTVMVCSNDMCCRSQAAPGHPARGSLPGTLLRWFSTVSQGFGFSFFGILLLTLSDSPRVLGCPGREEAGATLRDLRPTHAGTHSVGTPCLRDGQSSSLLLHF